MNFAINWVLYPNLYELKNRFAIDTWIIWSGCGAWMNFGINSVQFKIYLESILGSVKYLHWVHDCLRLAFSDQSRILLDVQSHAIH